MLRSLRWGIITSFLFAFIATQAASAPVVVVPGEGAGYIYYSASAGAAAAPVQDTTFVGLVGSFVQSPLPDGWVECAGQTVSAATYPALVKYLTGSDTATSAVMPDLRGYFLRGRNQNADGVGAARAPLNKQGDAIRNITGHTSASATRGLGDGASSGAFTKGTLYPSGVSTGSSNLSAYGVQLDASLVVPTANENRPHNIAVIYAMRAK